MSKLPPNQSNLVMEILHLSGSEKIEFEGGVIIVFGQILFMFTWQVCAIELIFYVSKILTHLIHVNFV